jgi:hypothetical protein
LDIDHRRAPTSSAGSSTAVRGSVEYLHAGRVASLEAMATRSFASRSGVGVGVRHSFSCAVVGGAGGQGSSRGRRWWWWWWWWRAGGATSFLFQLEGGGVRFLVPVSIVPPCPSTAWDTLVGLSYASALSIVVDAIVGELMCGVTSRLRLCFLRLILGKERVVGDYEMPPPDEEADDEYTKDDDRCDEEDRRLWRRAKEDAYRQVKLMMRQANVIAEREEERGGLVIVKATYGVMDNNSREWIRSRRVGRKDEDNGTNADGIMFHSMDATTQLQFWVADSALHLPPQSKRFMLGFYDVFAFVSDDELLVKEEQTHSFHNVSRCYSNIRFLDRRWWEFKIWRESKAKTDLSVVLSVRYKWCDKMYEMTIFDDEAVDLPSQFAQQVSILEG